MREQRILMLTVLASAVVVMAGCTNGQASRPSPEPQSALATSSTTISSPSPSEEAAFRLIAFSSYLKRKEYFMATRVLALNPTTFRPLPGAQLRLGDAVTNRLTDPAKELIALGGYNFGEVILVDPTELEIEAQIQVAPRPDFGSVHLVSWPKPTHLFGYVQQSAAHQLFRGRGFVADPFGREPVKSVSLQGGVMSAVATSLGAAFLVADVRRVGAARLVLLDMRGRKRTVALQEITAGFVDPGTAGESFHFSPALVSHGNVVYVIGAAEPVAAVNVQSGNVSYHSVPGLMASHLPATIDPATGTAGALESRDREASTVGPARVLVTGREAYPVRGGGYLRAFERVAQIVNLDKWQVKQTLIGLSDVRAAGPILFGRSSNENLVALSRNGSVLYRRPGRKRSWAVIGNHLLEAGTNGMGALELNIRTGRVRRKLGRLNLWPLDALTWPPSTREMSTVP
jgi:hypothetical protein